MIDEGAWDEALALLRDTPRVTLVCHEGPDGDALGSMLAVALALRARGVEVVASCDPSHVPRRYDFLPGQDVLVHPSSVDAAPDLMVTFDAGSFSQLGPLEPNARSARSHIVVDHHATRDMFGTVNLIDPSAAASAVIARELLRRLGAALTKDIATCLYVGLVTDTGRFQYANTTPAVHRLAGELLEAGVDHDTIAQRLFATQTVGYLKLAAVALGRLTVSNGMAWSWVSREDLARAGVTPEEAGGLIELVRTVDTADVAAVLRQQFDGKWLVSMRSRGATNVGALCESFGGGGHALAAGFRTREEPKVIVERIAGALARQ